MNCHSGFQCEQCNFRYDQEENVLNHKIAVHSKFECDMQAFVTRTDDVLQAHKSNKHSMRQFACSECYFILNSEIKLQEHKTKKHQTNKYPCDYCGFGAANLAQLDLHIESYHKITRQPAENNNFNESSRRYSLNERLKNGVCRSFNNGSCRFQGEGPMCPRFYVSMSLCVHISMCPRFYVANIMPNRPFVAMVLCVQSYMWPLMYKMTLCVVGPMCPGSNVTNALCVQGSMCPWLYVAVVYMLLYSI